MMKIGAFAAAVAALTSTAVAAETPNRPQLAAAVKAAHADNLKRLQDWIAHPTIAAEKTNVDGGAEYAPAPARGWISAGEDRPDRRRSQRIRNAGLRRADHARHLF